jgi:hypothetical protein
MTPAAMAMTFFTAPAEFHPHHILIRVNPEIRCCKHMLDFFGCRQAATGNGDNRGGFANHFPGETGPGNDGQKIVRQTGQGFADDTGHGQMGLVFNAFGRGHHHRFGTDGLCHALGGFPHDVRGNDHQDQVLAGYHGCQVVGGPQVGRQRDPGQIDLVFMLLGDLPADVGFIHPPIQLVSLAAQQIGQRRSPTAGPDHTDLQVLINVRVHNG